MSKSLPPKQPFHLKNETKSVGLFLKSSQLSYGTVQLGLSIVVFLFWTVFIFTVIKRNEIKNLQPQSLISITNKLMNLPKIRKVLILKDQLKELIYNFDIRKIQSVIGRARRTLSMIKYTILSNRPNPFNLRQMFNFMKLSLINFNNLSKSFSSVGKSVLYGLKNLLSVPGRIKLGLQSAKKEISNFWKFIEQIIQIVRLPIEVLRTISKFAVNIAAFMSRLQKPKLKL